MSVQVRRTASAKRVPPRRRRQRRKFRTTILSALKLAFVIGTVVVLGALTVNKAIRPFKLFSREDRETQRIAAELRDLRKENSNIERRINYLKSPQGIAEAARKLGYVRPGEVTLVIPQDNESGHDSSTAAPRP